MQLQVGMVLEGKVTGITKFGAFVALPDGKSGLVHISEIAYSYVNDVKDYLTEGQEVKVKVIGIDDNNRINLSIKKAMDPPPRPPRPAAPAAADASKNGKSARPKAAPFFCPGQKRERPEAPGRSKKGIVRENGMNSSQSGNTLPRVQAYLT